MVCDNAKDNCSFFRTKVLRFHHNFLDRAKSDRREDEIKEQFKQLRKLIKDYTRKF